MAERWEDADDVLARFRIAADGDAALRSELERWRLRFELLQMSALSHAA